MERILRNYKLSYLWANFDEIRFFPRETGLSHRVHVYVPYEVDMKVTPFIEIRKTFIKSAVKKQRVFFTVSSNPQIEGEDSKFLSDEEMAHVKRWIVLNQVALLKHWHQEISTFGLCRALVKLDGSLMYEFKD